MKGLAVDRCMTETPRVRRGQVSLLDLAEARRLAAVAGALGDPIRLQIVYLLGQYADLCTCEFEEILGLGQSRISYHLKTLLEAGVVAREVHGTWSHYRLRDPGVLDQVRALVSRAGVGRQEA
jgi:ArsR family transcriptional regulator